MPKPMSYDAWFAKASANAAAKGGPPPQPWQYDAYKYNVEHGTAAKGQTTASIEAGQTPGFSGQGDASGERAAARQYGRSEDYARFTEGDLAAWEQFKDTRCPPHSPYRAINGTGCVEKPIDTNYNAKNAAFLGVQPAKQGTWVGPGGQVRGPGGGAAPTGQDAGMSGAYQPMDPLQQKLMELLQNRGGFFGDATGVDQGAAFKGGGVWSWDQPQAAAPAPAPAPAAPAPARSISTPAVKPQPNPFEAVKNVVASPFAQAKPAPAGPASGGLFGGAPITPNPIAAQRMPQYKKDMISNPLNSKLYGFFG